VKPSGEFFETETWTIPSRLANAYQVLMRRAFTECDMILVALIYSPIPVVLQEKNVWIGVSGDQSILVIADDVFVCPPKAVGGLRKAILQRHTHSFISALHKGKFAASLNLDSSSVDMANPVP